MNVAATASRVFAARDHAATRTTLVRQMTTSLGIKARCTASRVLVITLTLVIVGGAASCGPRSNKSASPTTTVTTSSDATGSAADVDALIKVGISQAESKNVSQAETTFKDVLIISPKNVYALYNLGVIDETENNPTGALVYYNEALSSDSTYMPAMFNKAFLLESTDPNAAIALYKQIVAINPSAATAYLRMAFVYARQGQALKADEARAIAVKLNPSLSKYPSPAKCSHPSC
jgi:Tfp pilus assembly protein PilF